MGCAYIFYLPFSEWFYWVKTVLLYNFDHFSPINCCSSFLDAFSRRISVKPKRLSLNWRSITVSDELLLLQYSLSIYCNTIRDPYQDRIKNKLKLQWHNPQLYMYFLLLSYANAKSLHMWHVILIYRQGGYCRNNL